MKNIRKRIQWKKQLIQSLKIALAAFVAIAIAGELKLSNAATAGIITVLSIQNTKRETVRSAARRGAAFGLALFLSGSCFWLMGYTPGAFAVYLFLFALICLSLGWVEALAMDSVLVTHFLMKRSMSPEMILNEGLLLCIGVTMGLLVNLHLHKRGAEFERLAGEVDSQIKGILHRMSLWLPREDKEEYGADCFHRLEEVLEEAKLCAAVNYNNSLLKSDTGELDYIRMREKQSVLLEEIYCNIKRIGYLTEQAKQVAGLLKEIEEGFHKDNTVEELLRKEEALLCAMQEQELPASRAEFEARAILFYILTQIRRLLEIKREFVLRDM